MISRILGVSELPKFQGLNGKLQEEFKERLHQEAYDQDLWYIHGKAYDLSNFLYRHPGGKRALTMMRGQDATEMFEAYHCLFTKPYEMLDDFRVPDRDPLRYTPSFDWNPESPCNAFQNELRAEVKMLIANRELNIKMSWTKMIMVVIAYVVWILFTAYFWIYKAKLWSTIAVPVGFWIIGVNSFHDASHFAISRRDWVNNIFRYAFPYFSSPTTWDHQHVIAHHSYTNQIEKDPDLHQGMPWLRFHPDQPLFHQSKRMTLMFRLVMWLAATFIMSTLYDFMAVITKSYHSVAHYQPITGCETIVHIISRIFSVLFVGGPPVVYFTYMTWLQSRHETDWLVWGGQLSGAVILGIFWAVMFYMTFGFCFMSQTQVNHILEECIEGSDKKSQSWSVHQVETSHNFAPESKWWLLFSGGLNHQIEHHLFPGISHEYLPLIRPIVVRLARKYSIHYPMTTTYMGAFRKYMSQMDKMAEES